MSLRFQLPLSIKLQDDLNFANYLPGPNKTLLSILSTANSLNKSNDTMESSISSFVCLHGSSGVGRTHLLQAACHEADQFSQKAIYLPMQEIMLSSPKMLEGIETLDLICMDDIHVLAGNLAWEEAIFHLFNRVQEKGKRLIISANHIPTELKLSLPDLVSRLTWGITMPLQGLNDDEKQQALCLRAQFRGFKLNDTVARYIFYRSNKNMHQLFNILDELDQASLREKRKISIPFIRKIMSW